MVGEIPTRHQGRHRPEVTSMQAWDGLKGQPRTIQRAGQTQGLQQERSEAIQACDWSRGALD